MLLLDRVKMAAGSISSDEFNTLAKEMAEMSSKMNDSWVLKNSPINNAEIYLEKVTFEKNTSFGIPENCGKEETNDTLLQDIETVEDPDPGCLLPSKETQESFLCYQFHVIYSDSYSVPVLYFSVCNTDGKRLSLEELWRQVPVEYQRRIQDHKWATLTQQEHPYLGTPFFMLHPCHTASLMSQVPSAHDKRYYLVKWLSSVGPVVHLRLAPAYATAFGPVHRT